MSVTVCAQQLGACVRLRCENGRRFGTLPAPRVRLQISLKRSMNYIATEICTKMTGHSFLSFL
jgi:hypothetical protein